MAKKLGPNLTLAGPDDTLRLHLAFDVAMGSNIFTTPADDTVLVARVFRFRGLYYFVQTTHEGAHWVHAMRISRGQVQGFGTGYEQVLALSRRVKVGDFPELVRFRNAANDSLRLRFDKRQLRPFYVAQLDSIPAYKLLTTEPLPGPAKASVPPVAAIIGPYPNPAREQTTLSFATAANRLVTLYDNQGRRLRTLPTTGSRLTFSVADLPAGNYVVRISWPDSAAAPLTRRLLVQR
ncbi:T9SS type A sorting domain-containing protein [Hymenobacter lapidiphilus]|uniref:T9SS type A sorting domain-containing protein n=1 Tax=Hymenobacter sp. CCM 8763 TaxID=2303334 RepID=UPI00167C9AB5|nr:T9SS type A sorting domain-containing protein [Hymenobacter sp. CCM 8763]